MEELGFEDFLDLEGEARVLRFDVLHKYEEGGHGNLKLLRKNIRAEICVRWTLDFLRLYQVLFFEDATGKLLGIETSKIDDFLDSLGVDWRDYIIEALKNEDIEEPEHLLSDDLAAWLILDFYKYLK